MQKRGSNVIRNELGKYLKLRGYEVFTEQKVGERTADMVVEVGKKKVCIECAGPRGLRDILLGLGQSLYTKNYTKNNEYWVVFGNHNPSKFLIELFEKHEIKLKQFRNNKLETLTIK